MFLRILALIAINTILYYRTLKYGLVSDDIPTFQKKPEYKNVWHKLYLRLFEGAKFNPKIEHLYTIIVHTLVSISIYIAFGKTDISFLTAVLFAINPANNQGSIWISGRGYAMTALFLMCAMAYPYLSPLFLIGAMHHPSGFFAPLAFLGSSLFWMPLAAIPALLIKWKRIKIAVKAKMIAEHYPGDKGITFHRVLIALKTYGFYFALALIPFHLTFYHNLLESAAGHPSRRKRASKPTLFTILGVSVIVGMVIRSFFVWDAVSWGILWFSVCIAPFCNLIRMNQEIADRYLYVANIGLMYALANIIIQYPIAITAIMTFYAVRLWYFLPAYTDDYWLIEYSVIEDPRAWFAWHIRGHKMLERGGMREAMNMFVMGKLISPKEFKILYNIACVLRLMGRIKESDQFFKEAEDNIIEGQEEESKKLIEQAKTGNIPLVI